MKNFNYCIWITSKNENKYKNFTNGFQLHMTLNSHLTKLQAEDLIKKYQLNENKNISIVLSEKLYYTEEKEFYALHKKVIKIDDFDLPNNAHISFYYSYIPISDNIYNYVKDKISTLDKIFFDTVLIKLCNNHFLSW